MPPTNNNKAGATNPNNNNNNDKSKQVLAQVEEVTGIMNNNIGAILVNIEKAEDVQKKSGIPIHFFSFLSCNYFLFPVKKIYFN